jgi:hypothetical protein
MEEKREKHLSRNAIWPSFTLPHSALTLQPLLSGLPSILLTTSPTHHLPPTYPSIHSPPTYPCSHLHTCPLTHPSIHPSTHLFTHPPTHSSSDPPFLPLMHTIPSVHLLTQSTHLSAHSFVHPPYPSIHPSTLF